MRTVALLLAMGILSCNAQPKSESNELKSTTQEKADPDFNVALKFINDYTRFCLSDDKNKLSDTAWVQQNSLLTVGFKKSHKAILDSAWRADKELGLGFDPVFDAQDFPDKGFIILKTDKAEGYVTVAGNGWKEFELVLQIKLINNKWLVDAAGIINIPKSKRASL